MDELLQDLRYALRALVRRPGFTAAAVLLLALGIGGSTALFSAVEEAILSPPPYPDPDRLVVVDNLFGRPGEEMGASTWSLPRLRAFRDDVRSVEDAAGYAARTATLTELGDPTLISVETVTPSYFRLLGIDAVRGRAFGPEEEDDGAPARVALVSHRFWRTRMGADPAAVGRILTLDRTGLRVVGVLPSGFDGLSGGIQVWIPLSALRVLEDASFLEDPWNQYFHVVGRLVPSTSLERARAEVRAFGATIMDRFPPPEAASAFRAGADLVPFAEARVNPLARASMLALFGAVTLMLLAAAANVAALLLARGAGRRLETALRASLGAGRGRIFRQHLTESLALAGLGGLVGVCVAWAGLDLLGAGLAEAVGTGGGRGLEYLDPENLSLDRTVLAFSLLLTCGVGVLFGVFPAWQALRTDPGAALRGGRGRPGGRSAGVGLPGRGSLVTLQIAAALVLLTGAALTLRSVAKLQAVDLGYEPHGLLTATYTLTPADVEAGVDPATFHLELLERLRALPGVTGASLGEVPAGGPTYRTIVMGSEGRPDLTPRMHTWIRLQPVSGEHLDVLGLRLVEGRGIRATDGPETRRVVVLNRTAAGTLFPDGSPLGRRIQLPWDGFMGEGATVVGVVEDMEFGEPGSPPELQGFVSLRQAPRLAAGLLIRAVGNPSALIPAVRSALAELNPALALTSAATLEARLADLTARPRVVSVLLSLFAGVAVILVAVGLYGVLAFTVARRTRELGVRAALGADRRSLLGLMLGQGAAVAVLGTLLGLLGALWLAPFLDRLLFEVEPLDPAAFGAAALTILGVALAASWLPARRATRIDPMEALRAE
ncbi:MAG TPA: ADOP family duplicated permease [Longimicrobiales bacterium]|nr:ADOP family duplicated permease [Longimicrobiales bacterium]